MTNKHKLGGLIADLEALYDRDTAQMEDILNGDFYQGSQEDYFLTAASARKELIDWIKPILLEVFNNTNENP